MANQRLDLKGRCEALTWWLPIPKNIKPICPSTLWSRFFAPGNSPSAPMAQTIRRHQVRMMKGNIAVPRAIGKH
jgi:hypothetical protein